MAHKEQFDFCNSVKAEFLHYFDNKKVLDGCFYLGCDVDRGLIVVKCPNCGFSE